MTYYSYWGEFPKVLPKFHVTFDGSMVFDLSKMSDQQLHELGYVKVAPPPDWRSFELRIDWDGHGWVILDNDTEETHKKYNDDWNKIRADRNWLLKETDYTGSFDLPEEMKKEWGEYRQKLRDITDSVHTYNPAEVKFPEMPKLKTPYEYAQSEEEDGKKK
jgi:hypothetical protein